MAKQLAVLFFAWGTFAHLANETIAADMRFETTSDRSGKPAAVELRGLNESQIARLKTAEHWPEVFEVRVADASPDTPAVSGHYALEGDVIRFTPRFRFQAGLSYKARLTAAPDLGLKPVTREWSIPSEQATDAAMVEAVYPSAETLPENQLKFYLHFSAPMSRGEAYEHVRLLREDDSAVDLPFLEIGEELWGPSGKRLTLLIDPGRIKQGVKPREDIGPVLEAGRRYTLQIDQAWSDAQGRPLARGFEKSFTVGPPVAGALNTRDWKFDLPAAGTVEPLRVRFPAPLDHALLQRTLWIETTNGEVAGTATAADRELRWEFTPTAEWKEGPHWLVVDTVLEDLGGNRIGSAFEVDALDPLQKRVEMKTVRLPLSIPAPAAAP